MNQHKKAIDRTLTKFSLGYWLALLWIAGVAFGGHLSMKSLIEKQAFWDGQISLVEEQIDRSARVTALLKEGGVSAEVLQSSAAKLLEHQSRLLEMDQIAPGDDVRTAMALYEGAAASIATPLGMLAAAARRNDASAPSNIAAANRAATQLETAYRGVIDGLRTASAKASARAESMATWSFYSVIALLGGVALLIFRPLSQRLRKIAQQLVEAHEELHRTARHDALTGLPNRSYMREFLNDAIRQARDANAKLAVIHYDLVGFRSLNKLIGEDFADAALKHVAEVIRTNSRKGDFVARVGIDEFAVIQATGADANEISVRAKGVSKQISSPVDINGMQLELLNVSAAAIGEAGELDAERMVKNAEIAVTQAKLDGAGSFTLYTPEMREAFEAKQQMRIQIKEAFERDEFEPYFQPQICLRTGAIDGFEALARWRHPSRGVLTPYYFLYAAAEFGVGDKLDELIMEKSLDAMVEWRRAGVQGLKVGVNFASEQLSDPFMIEKIKWALDRRELSPDCVCIEILETVLMEEEGEDTIRNIEGLGRAGFAIDLDDFGTGHASIATLQQMRVDRIKIDRSFVTDIDTKEDRQKVVSAMISLAHSLDTKVLAEGVETDGEFLMLRELGCDYVQGFGIARPMPGPDVVGWCKKYEAALTGSVESLAG